MSHPVNAQALDILFRKARTHNSWLNKPVSDDTLRQLYELMKWGPTSFNCCPARLVFLRTPEAKQRLLPALSPTNVQKTMTAPVTAIVAYDMKFYEKLPTLFPHNPKAREWFSNSPELAETTAFRNGTLQGAYFILAARSMPKSIKSSSLRPFQNLNPQKSCRKVLSNRISCATWVTATPPSCFLAVRA